MSEAHGRVGTVINGKWQVDDRIGSGGMATVYAVTHRNGHRAALKMLHTQLSRDPSTRARFLREGYVANAVGHPGVVTVLDDGVAEDGSAFLVLELLEGETIDARRARLGGKLPIDEALDHADQALDALAAAHEKGIVHRDVKPENVFVTNAGRIKLLDFGLARMKDVEAEPTKTGVTIGTPEFMPPEQAIGRRDIVDARSDVWSLGATLFTAITGRYVHDEAQSIRAQLIASATVRPKPIRQFAPHVSPAVAQVIDRALELEMDDRWPSARDMQAALRAARGRGPSAFTLESETLPRASVRASSQLSHDESGSFEATMHMADAVVPSRREPPQLHEIEDVTDMEQTLVKDGERTLTSPLAIRASTRPLSPPAFGVQPQMPSGDYDYDDDAHADTVAVSSVPGSLVGASLRRSPQAFPASTSPAQYGPPPHAISVSEGASPMSVPRPTLAPEPPQVSNPSDETEDDQGSWAHLVVFLSMTVILICAIIVAFALWRGMLFR